MSYTRFPASSSGGGMGAVVWGSITGTLSSQTDLQTALNGKQPTGNYITALTGDGTASGPGSVAFTLATVNGSPGTFGSASQTLTATVNGKGLITALSAASIAIAQSQVTNLVTDLAGKQPTGNYITALTGDVTAAGPGSAAASISSTTVTGKLITGFVSGAGTVSATDTILQAINKLDGNIAGKQPTGSYITALTGDVTASGPGSASATIADATVTGKLITGFVSGAGTVTASDSILQAINKLDGNIATKQPTGNYITALTGDVTASGPGSASATISDTTVTGKLLTGYSATSGTIAATDTILQAFGKIGGSLAPTVAQATTAGAPAAAANSPWIFDTVTFDTNSAYNSTTGIYTCPSAGYFFVSGVVFTASGPERITVYKNLSAVVQIGVINSNGNGNFCGLVSCAANDEIFVSSDTTAGTITVNLGTLNIQKV